MNNQEPKSRMQRYNFNTEDNKGPKRPHKSPRLRQIIIGFIIALVLVVGVGVWLANRSTSVENSDPESSEIASDSSDNESDSQVSNDDDSSSDDVDDDDTDNVNNNGTDATTQNNASTPSVPSQNQGTNQESNVTTKNGGQNPSSASNRNQNAQSSASSRTSESSTQPSQDTEKNDSSTPGGIDFSSSHTFSSVEDARSWAAALRSNWLAQGYTNYTITQDPQGNYVLTFTK
ncbi:hypothetical protein [uncultured Secundilactobacillus sp.]|uniref:hypothetical protein n=1 Tax=uncultured Secundilactobacillus sp. TaxID=2813935 RepID=UPI00258D3078|nr:hypothetical protein [uncultured Secundilactobacillus sp.]